MVKIAVMSGKGGVGKSSVSIMLSVALSEMGKTLLLDFDLCGPSVVCGLGVRGIVRKASKGFVPVQVTDNLYVLSMGLMMNDTDTVIWRGPKKMHMLSMLYDSIDEFENVVIDMPPGLSEEHGFLRSKDIWALIVTTPQEVSLHDCSRAIDFCMQNDICILGLVENMSGYRCECCGAITNIFGSKGGQRLAESIGIPFLCTLEIDPILCKALDDGVFANTNRSLGSYVKFRDTITKVIDHVIDKMI
ncbi:MRP-like protein [Ordospora colligata]|uniref:MRP-like protein n=1 Tax=Ordospora colligata OC4 TaxID=1354746 RepID=A0A0B2UJB6_9MICR|nr:MRP-like protein [Ordospora colligata OC4]KHN69147.1 MRP-like protein [Ordospora colligata OC4]TBU14602.1 MRP-like protein [Ordospora colligata]TBU14796.1 MRP-like protein [Ordospora colligata]TBU18119.1 MRP-like protein [Ordospora colligata]